MIVYAVIVTDSVAARGLVNGWCLIIVNFLLILWFVIISLCYDDD